MIINKGKRCISDTHASIKFIQHTGKSPNKCISDSQFSAKTRMYVVTFIQKLLNLHFRTAWGLWNSVFLRLSWCDSILKLFVANQKSPSALASFNPKWGCFTSSMSSKMSMFTFRFKRVCVILQTGTSRNSGLQRGYKIQLRRHRTKVIYRLRWGLWVQEQKDPAGGEMTN